MISAAPLIQNGSYERSFLSRNRRLTACENRVMDQPNRELLDSAERMADAIDDLLNDPKVRALATVRAVINARTALELFRARAQPLAVTP